MAERERQDEQVAAGRLPFNCSARQIADVNKLPVLMEEVGEVATEVYEFSVGRRVDKYELRKELLQTAAVCVAWLEALWDEPVKYPAHQPQGSVLEEGAA